MPLTFTFTVRSLLGDTPEARAKAWRELEIIMDQAVFYFSPEGVKALVKKTTKRGKPGRKPEASINERILAEYDVAVRDVAPNPVNKTELGRRIYEKYHEEYGVQSPEAVVRQLDRLLKKRRSPQRQN